MPYLLHISIISPCVVCNCSRQSWLHDIFGCRTFTNRRSAHISHFSKFLWVRINAVGLKPDQLNEKKNVSEHRRCIHCVYETSNVQLKLLYKLLRIINDNRPIGSARCCMRACRFLRRSFPKWRTKVTSATSTSMTTRSSRFCRKTNTRKSLPISDRRWSRDWVHIAKKTNFRYIRPAFSVR